jgi:hypothetical protein
MLAAGNKIKLQVIESNTKKRSVTLARSLVAVRGDQWLFCRLQWKNGGGEVVGIWGAMCLALLNFFLALRRVQMERGTDPQCGKG